MSKDVVIAGVIVAACLGLVTVAFVLPRHKTPAPDLAAVDPITPEPDLSPTTPVANNDPFAGTDHPFAPTNNTTPPMNNNPGANPFAPVNSQPGNSFTPISDFPPSQPTLPRNDFPTPNLPPVNPINPLPTTPTSTEVQTHVVAAGETLGEISQKYYNTSRNWKKIAEANKLDPSELKVGQKITIPVVEKSATTSTGTPVELAGGESSYTLKKGDSYYSIAKQELGNAARWKEIEKLNGIPAEELRSGKTIKLPAKEAAVTSISTPPSVDVGSTGNGRVHVVAAGETLSDISKKHFGTTTKWKDIVKANPGVDPEGLHVGQKLNLPEIAGVSPSPTDTGSSNASAPVSVGTYTVKAGDTLASIAESQLGSSKSWQKIVEANPGLDPRKMRIGQKLVIPGKSGSSNDGGSTTPPPANPGFGFGSAGNSGFGNGNSSTLPSNNSFGPSNSLPTNNSFGPGNTTPSNNSFGPGSSTLPSGNGFDSVPAYPTPNSTTPSNPITPTGTTPPPSNTFQPTSNLPDSFGGSSGFNNTK
jgi:nucleoid-associated protein YgaU